MLVQKATHQLGTTHKEQRDIGDQLSLIEVFLRADSSDMKVVELQTMVRNIASAPQFVLNTQ